jgi:hypothetical protein
LTKMGIPIFVRPGKELASAALRRVERRSDRFHFTLENTGTVHVVPHAIRVRGLAGSTERFVRPLDGWYVLAGGHRNFEMALPPENCRDVTSLVVVVEFASGALEERLQTPGGACGH